MRLKISATWVSDTSSGSYSYTLSRRETDDCEKLGDEAPLTSATECVANTLGPVLEELSIAGDGWCFVWRFAQTFLKSGAHEAAFSWKQQNEFVLGIVLTLIPH